MDVPLQEKIGKQQGKRQSIKPGVCNPKRHELVVLMDVMVAMAMVRVRNPLKI